MVFGGWRQLEARFAWRSAMSVTDHGTGDGREQAIEAAARALAELARSDGEFRSNGGYAEAALAAVEPFLRRQAIEEVVAFLRRAASEQRRANVDPWAAWAAGLVNQEFLSQDGDS